MVDKVAGGAEMLVVSWLAHFVVVDVANCDSHVRLGSFGGRPLGGSLVSSAFSVTT